MADPPTPAPGQIGWIDRTVPDAQAIRDFLQRGHWLDRRARPDGRLWRLL